MEVPERTRSYREQYRQTVPPGYGGVRHFAFVTLTSLGFIALAVSRVHAPSLLEWLTVPVAFLFANWGEYRAHRGPMHHPTRGLRALFKRHAGQHHRFFTRDAMMAETPRDYRIVLFPAVLLLFFLGGLATPAALVLFVIASPNVGWLFAATAVSYYLTYEWLHLTYHLDPNSLGGRLPGVAALRRHHTLHHDPRLMQKWNFNITFPICDALFGTRYPKARE